MNIIIIIAVIVFFISLSLMDRTKLGVPGIKKYDANFKLLDMRFRYSPDDVYTTLTNIESSGRKAYLHYQLLDFIFIISFFVIMYAISGLVKNEYMQMSLIIIAALRGLFDIIENSFIIYLINTFPKKHVIASATCSWFTTFKFCFLILWILVFLFTMLILLIGKLF